MNLPSHTTIAPEKIANYLLVRQARGDKSLFLARAGYSINHAEQLAADLRSQLLPLTARLVEHNQFGDYCEICGLLTGPNGVGLRVRTIWLTDTLSGRSKFITLLPDKSPK
ncbi:MAG: hypothetical protein RLZZ350_1429 [Verrucomicrobiota bacterium]|jgi:hypothetical protein